MKKMNFSGTSGISILYILCAVDRTLTYPNPTGPQILEMRIVDRFSDSKTFPFLEVMLASS